MLRSFDDRARATWSRLVAFYGFLILFNVAAWLAAFAAFIDRPVLLGTAGLAYILGLRHGVDADHIAAIDNVVRKLMQEGKRPFLAGFFFSLGHSTIVVLAVLVIVFTAGAFQDQFEMFSDAGSTIGTVVSAIFMLGIGLANVFVLKGVWAGFHRVRRGEQLIGEDLNQLLSGHGVIARFARPLFRMVGRSWHMYPLGVLFGLGFDTASEIGLLAISATQASQGLSVWCVLLFPALFTAGMTLIDATDSVLMVGAYDWAFVKPLRKLWYNMTITAASIAVALFIGGLEALGLLCAKLRLSGGVWDLVGALNRNLANFGFAVIGIFAAAWAVSVLVYRWRGYDRLATPISPN